jgi:murein DD-endopeptidase MepM/ murein hydrolase activator NlpD
VCRIDMKSVSLKLRGALVFIVLISICSCMNKGEKKMNENILKVSFPLKGVYISPNTPGSKVPSHGTNSFGETYAIDFVMINEEDKLKKSYRSSFVKYIFKGLPLEDFYGWGQTVYSPVSGEIIGVENNIDERNPVNIISDYINTIEVTKQFTQNGVSSKIITGNYVMIKIDEKKFALLAHLKKGSINVVVGKKISVHDIIGELGHSGNSTMPHLHMQFMDSDNYKIAKGLPFVFDSYELKKGNKWVKIYNSVPREKNVIRYGIK